MHKKKESVILEKKLQVFIKIILALSAPFLTFLLSNDFPFKHILIGTFFSFCICLFLIFKIFKIERISLERFFFSSIVALYVIKVLLLFCDNNALIIGEYITRWSSLVIETSYIKIILGLCSLPFVLCVVYWLGNVVVKYLRLFVASLTKVEKKYLLVILLISVIFSIGVCLSTTAFSIPKLNGNVINYDVVYTSDSGFIVNYDAYLNVSNPENDIRQPLFGIFAFPFALIAKFVSDFCFFLPNSLGYVICLTIIQFMLTCLSTILLGKLLCLDEKYKKYFYLLFSFSFPYIVFNLILEQYVVGLFYLILAIYLYYQDKDRINYMYIGAVGTLITSGIIFPLITKFDTIKNWFIKCFKCFLAFVSVLVIGGQFPQVFRWISRFDLLVGNYTGKLSFYDKFCQFTHFLQGIFFSNSGQMQYVEGHPSYQLVPFTTISIIGVVILFIVIISFIKNRNNIMARVSILWIVFSILILLVMGWGTQENGLILYSLYFAWAYFVLIFLFLKDMFKNKNVFAVAMVTFCFVMLICNVGEFINVLKFAVQYY